MTEAAPRPAPSLRRRIVAWARMTWQSIPYFLGIRKACEGFRNLDAIGELPPRVHAQGDAAS